MRIHFRPGITGTLRSLAVLLMAALTTWPGAARAQDAGMTLTVELGDVSATKLPFIVAAESGIYTRNGLTVTQFITPGAADNVRQSGVIVPPEFVKSGIVGDINIGGGSPTIVRMTSVATAPQRIILATNAPTTDFHLYARSGIATFADLKGKRIGYINPGALDGLLFMAIAKKLGWDPVHDVSMLSGVAGGSVAAKTDVDAFIGDAFIAGEAAKDGYRDLGDLSGYQIPILGSGVNALKSWLPTHRAAAAAFIKSTVEALALMKTDKRAAFSAMTKWYGISDPALLEPIYDQAITLPAKPYPSAAGLAVVRSIYAWREMEIHPDAYFIDPSFVAALDQSGYIDSLYRH
jgi:ABC-type nitrate/sulfonate/bicarbonate transport system substrate-binding protein